MIVSLRCYAWASLLLLLHHMCTLCLNNWSHCWLYVSCALPSRMQGSQEAAKCQGKL
jgi:hypothetical protein